MDNQLIHENSPYLLSHAHQAVDWYPWCEKAFSRAREENKPVFLSIGYSTCHWCHVMARESFEDEEIAELLNENFISVKVDREERPDLDSIYMEVCQSLTGSGGWPMSLFLTPEKKPFFAGTYFPKDSRGGMVGFRQLLTAISEKWREDSSALINSARQITITLSHQDTVSGDIDHTLPEKAVEQFSRTFDKAYGGFGDAPKFPTPHNLIFLLDNYVKTKNTSALFMAETTLKQMYRGGLFDHVGYGFSRYSTDRAYQIPHFEKMLYDNALLIMAYAKAYDVTMDIFYLDVAEKTADYILREMQSHQGGFFTAQDADSQGVEGRFYVFAPGEIQTVLGEKIGEDFNRCYGITPQGNFEGFSIPHLTGEPGDEKPFEKYLPSLREYRKSRGSLPLDDKILTGWNGLMIAALAQLARVSGEERYYSAAIKCTDFLYKKLWEKDCLYNSYRAGIRGVPGYLDDYAFVAFGMLELYQITNDPKHLKWAKALCRSAIKDFWDNERGGFFFSGSKNEALIFQRKETHDGALPSGNSVMAHNLVRLLHITEDRKWEDIARQQLKFLSGFASQVPMAHSFYLLALSCWLSPKHVTLVLAKGDDKTEILKKVPLDAIVTVLPQPTEQYRLLDNRTTYYFCENHACLPPSNVFPKQKIPL